MFDLTLVVLTEYAEAMHWSINFLIGRESNDFLQFFFLVETPRLKYKVYILNLVYLSYQVTGYSNQ